MIRDAVSRDLDTVQFIIDHLTPLGDPSQYYTAVLADASAIGAREICEYAHDHGATNYEAPTYEAATHDQVEIARVIREWCIAEHQEFDYELIIDASISFDRVAVLRASLEWFIVDQPQRMFTDFAHTLRRIIKCDTFMPETFTLITEFARVCGKPIDADSIKTSAAKSATNPDARAFVAAWSPLPPA